MPDPDDDVIAAMAVLRKAAADPKRCRNRCDLHVCIRKPHSSGSHLDVGGWSWHDDSHEPADDGAAHIGDNAQTCPACIAAREQPSTPASEDKRGECEGCGCCSWAGCHRFADATCPTNSLGDSVCPCTEE